MIRNKSRSDSLRSENTGSQRTEREAGIATLLDRDGHHGSETQLRQPREEECDLQRRVENFLAGRSVPSLRRLIVEVDGNCVSLRGLVRTYYEKQLAISCCQRVAGVLNVVDSIEVQQDPTPAR